jgi:hypothetical protein
MCLETLCKVHGAPGRGFPHIKLLRLRHLASCITVHHSQQAKVIRLVICPCPRRETPRRVFAGL